MVDRLKGRVALYSEPAEEKAIFKDGGFTIDELFNLMPSILTEGLINPAPPQD